MIIYLVGEMEFANFYGSILPHTIKAFNVISKAKDYQKKDPEKRIIKRVILK